MKKKNGTSRKKYKSAKCNLEPAWCEQQERAAEAQVVILLPARRPATTIVLQGGLQQQ